MKLILSLAALLAFAAGAYAQSENTMENALSLRQQHLVAVAAFEAKGDIASLEAELDAAFDDGLTESELKEALSHLYAYTGFPRSLNGLSALQRVIASREAAGKAVDPGKEADPLPEDFDALEAGTRVQTQLTGRGYRNDFAPATDYYLKAHLFGDIFARNNLSYSDRELVTLGALSALEGVDPQRASHAAGSLNMGVTEEQLKSVPATLAARVGQLEASRAASTISRLFGIENAFPEPHGGEFGMGAPNTAYASVFIGQSYLKGLTKPGDAITISNVTFEPGCRNNWHIHHASSGGGQVLICVEGEGWYQEWGKEAQSLKPGDVVVIPAGVKHWHGAKSGSWFSHLAFGIPGTDTSNEWLEPVDEAQYSSLPE